MPACLTRLSGILIVAAAIAIGPSIADAAECTKKNSVLPAGGAPNEDLVVSAKCSVPEGSYTYKNVNIIDGGTLNFADGKTDFYAKSILIEYGGSMVAGYDVTDPKNPKPTPIGTKPGAVLTIHLYGMEDERPVDPAKPDGPKDTLHGVGIPCYMKNCGVPTEIWCSQPDSIPPDPMDQHADCPRPRPTVHNKVDMKNGTDPDWFYRYHPLIYDGGLGPHPVTKMQMPGYFGYKVIGVSYGGTLLLLGKTGSIVDGTDPDLIAKTGSGTSWRRLAVTARGGDTITLDKAVDWRKDDWIVVSTTDYVPGHSEKRQIADVPVAGGGKVIKLTQPLTWTHNGTEFDLSETGPNTVPARLGLPNPKMENRAAVALLTRSIRIVSDGLVPNTPLPNDSYFGAHTLARQGLLKFQVQGVEFENMGQGGRIAHYPVHFHLARKAPKDTFVKDTSVNESMTRWYTIHGTHNVTLARNVGWKSIGHGYYLEEGTEIDNNLISNIGIYARAALKYPGNPRNVPGILARERSAEFTNPGALAMESVPFYSDYDHPSIFWIMNAWNRFEDNMAVGASGCGVCYWMLPGGVSGHSRDQQWEGYAVIQMGADNNAADRAGLTPVKSFVGNGCSSAAMSFNVIGNGPACQGVGKDLPNYITVEAVPNPLAPERCDQSNPLVPGSTTEYVSYACNQPKYKDSLAYYPQIGGGGRFPTKCDATDASCKTASVCGSQSPDVSMCVVTVIDRYTTSFNWTEQNYAVMWLRPQWYLVTNSFISDVVGSGLSIVTGGGYTASDAVYGHWGLVYRTAFIGQTQDPAAPGNAATPFTSHLSPFNPQPGALKCQSGAAEDNRCLSAADGITYPRSNFGVNQRMFNIYDGPSYQSSNAYINITKGRPGPTCPGGVCARANWVAALVKGLPKDAQGCYMPNAAIGWKQPNGFYYPPAFHSENLYFKNVEIRHFVTQPLFKGNTYETDQTKSDAAYCAPTDGMFSGAWTDIDRQTVLNDDDGSLTGWSNTISVNKDAFFSAPTEQLECASDETANTSPYDYVTSVIFPECRVSGTCGNIQLVPTVDTPKWSVPCSNELCAGVPMYRQYANPPAKPTDPRHFIRMAGQSTGQRSTLATNNGLYYIDTTVSADTQAKVFPPLGRPPSVAMLSLFEADKTYYSFLIYAKPNTRQSYKIYVGKSTEGAPDAFDLKKDVWPVRVDIRKQPPVFDPPEYDASSKWRAPKNWGKIYDPKTGILEVTMDMTNDAKFESDYKAGLAEGCEPSTFCKLDGAGVCGCAIDPITKKPSAGCSAAVCKWAGKDTACPEGGCWGFGFKLTKNFDTVSKPTAPPDIECFPGDAAAGWNVKFLDPDPKIESAGNTCYKPAYKPPVFCKNPT